jgi:glycosyltransferase involved in cell wall biosynthesis
MATIPYFSIIIPAYNRANILIETLDFVQNQSFDNWECIIVDDGSTDNTKEVVKEVADKDSRVRYVYQNNAERSVARNHGAEVAKGRYLLFLDSDDGYCPDHLELLYNFIQQNNAPVSLIIVDNWELHDSGKLVLPDSSYDGLDILPYLWSVPVVPVRVCIQNTIVKTHKFDPKITVVEDQVLWFHIAASFNVLRAPQRTAIYRIHDGNSVAKGKNPFEKRLAGLNLMFKDKQYAKAKNLIPSSVRNKMIAQCHFRIGEFNLLNGKRWKALSDFINCQIKSPGFRLKACLYLLIKH